MKQLVAVPMFRQSKKAGIGTLSGLKYTNALGVNMHSAFKGDDSQVIKEILDTAKCLLEKTDREWGTEGGIWPETRNDLRIAISKYEGA